MPPGLTLSGGVLSGTPTTAGTYTFVLTATDSTKCTGRQDYSLTIGAGCSVPLALKPGTMPGGTVGTAFSQAISASGGTAPYTYAVTSGSLPPGLTLDPSTGAISGTPTATGTYSFTVTATDATKCTGSGQYSIVVGSCTYGPVVIVSVHYTGGWVNVHFTASGQVPCGDPPIGVSDNWVTARLVKYANNKGVVKITVLLNTNVTSRSAEVYIGGSVFPVKQDGAPCKVTALSMKKLTVPAPGGLQSIDVTATEGECPWTASVNGAAGTWITMITGSGAGPGTTTFMVSPNTTGKNRTGTISVGTALGKKNVTIKQTP